jgi:REP-associated tyrosine transposase
VFCLAASTKSPRTSPCLAASICPPRRSTRPSSARITRAMFAAPYSVDEVQFAYCNRIFLRWRTHRNRPILALAALDQCTLSEIAAQYGLEILQSESSQNELMAQVSMKPNESISTCASKLKGQVSKWVRLKLALETPHDLLSKGYFACTVGDTTSAAVEAYLLKQCEHHGYASRVLPPVYLREYEPAADHDSILAPRHAWVLARFHLVFSTWHRRGVFGSAEARAVAEQWEHMQTRLRFKLIKVSFVPDHVHIAVRLHPAVSPAALSVELMNAAQELACSKLAQSVIKAGVERLWQPSAYLGSYGDLASGQIRAYIDNWVKEDEQA